MLFLVFCVLNGKKKYSKDGNNNNSICIMAKKHGVWQEKKNGHKSYIYFYLFLFLIKIRCIVYFQSFSLETLKEK